MKSLLPALLILFAFSLLQGLAETEAARGTGVVREFVEPAGLGATRVEVVSKKAMSTNVLAPDWAKDVLDKLDQKLAPKQ